jgi:hypothetical protein
MPTRLVGRNGYEREDVSGERLMLTRFVTVTIPYPPQCIPYLLKTTR